MKLSCLLAILLLAFALRLAGNSFGAMDSEYNQSLDPLLPDQAALHPDEYFYVSIPMRMLTEGRLNPKFFENPSFLINLNFLTFWLNGEAIPDDTSTLSERSYASFPLYFIGRMYSALGGLLAVAGAIGLSNRLSGKWAGLAAGLMATFAFPLVQHSHYATTSSLAAGFAIFCAWASVLAFKYPTKSRYWLLAGILAGLATGNRYNAGAISIMLFVLGMVTMINQRKPKIILSVLLGYLAFPLSFLVTSPYVLLDYSEFWQQFSFIYGAFTQSGSDLPSPEPSLWLEWRYIIVFALGLFGLVPLLHSLKAVVDAWHFKRYFFVAVYLSLLAVILPYSLVVLNNQRPANGDQLTVVILPLVIVMAAMGLSAFNAPKLRAFFLVASLIFPVMFCFQWLSLLQKPDTRVLMQEWVYQHVPRQSRILLIGGYNIHLDPLDYQVQQVFSLQNIDFQAENYDYLLVSDAGFFQESRRDRSNYEALLNERLAFVISYPLLLEIPRPRWLFDDWLVNNASYWHNPRLMLYCLKLTLCPALEN
jgi:hypothetical protein